MSKKVSFNEKTEVIIYNPEDEVMKLKAGGEENSSSNSNGYFNMINLLLIILVIILLYIYLKPYLASYLCRLVSSNT